MRVAWARSWFRVIDVSPINADRLSEAFVSQTFFAYVVITVCGSPASQPPGDREVRGDDRCDHGRSEKRELPG